MQGPVRLRMHVRGIVVGGIVQHGERRILGKGKRLKSGVGGDYVSSGQTNGWCGDGLVRDVREGGQY